MTYTIGIVAHPARASQAIRLADTVHAAIVSLDHDGVGGKANHLRTLTTLANSDADWLTILEDDALPCPNFHAHLEQALTDAPSPIISLYLGTGRWAATIPASHQPHIQRITKEADDTGAHWIAGNMWHAVAYAIRSDMAPQLIAGIESIPAPIDQAIGIWARLNNHHVAYTWPSHADHRDQERVTEGKEHNVPRRAWKMCNASL